MNLPEIAVVGRTNSGKSSLLNHLLGKTLAKTSSRSGKTTAIDLYLINDSLILADVPGYGFEHKTNILSKKWQRVWGPLCEGYLKSTPSLRAVLFLADIRWRPIEDDRNFSRTLSEAAIPALLVLTKDDRINDAASARLVAHEAGTDVSNKHESRSYLTSRVRSGLDWPATAPHIHYSTELVPPRKKLRRWIDSLHHTTDTEQAAAVLLAGSSGGSSASQAQLASQLAVPPPVLQTHTAKDEVAIEGKTSEVTVPVEGQPLE